MTDSIAIQQSLQRLQKAKDALHRLEGATSLAHAEAAWSDLLLAGSGIYSKIEQGSKIGGGSAQGWFGMIKRKRKDDSLLSYMHHARNSDEHGIEEITSTIKVGGATVRICEPFDPAKLEGVQLTIDTDQLGNVKFHSPNENLVSTE